MPLIFVSSTHRNGRSGRPTRRPRVAAGKPGRRGPLASCRTPITAQLSPMPALARPPSVKCQFPCQHVLYTASKAGRRTTVFTSTCCAFYFTSSSTSQSNKMNCPHLSIPRCVLSTVSRSEIAVWHLFIQARGHASRRALCDGGAALYDDQIVCHRRTTCIMLSP